MYNFFRCKRTYRKIAIVILWLIPPLLPWHFTDLFPVGFKEIIPINPSDYAQESSAVNSTLSSTSTNPTVFHQITGSEKQNSEFNDLSRFSPLVGVPWALIRYDVSVQNNISVEIAYSNDPSDNKVKQLLFQSTLSCGGTTENFNEPTLIDSGLYLGDRTNDDRDRVEKIIASCVGTPTFAFQNDTSKTLLVQHISLSPDSAISFLVTPDLKSKIFIFIGWYIVWFGFLILIREGFCKSFKD